MCFNSHFTNEAIEFSGAYAPVQGLTTLSTLVASTCCTLISPRESPEGSSSQEICSNVGEPVHSCIFTQFPSKQTA